MRNNEIIRVYKVYTGHLPVLRVSTFRKVVLGYSYVDKKAYDLLVGEFVSFESVLRHCGHPRHPYITSTDVMIIVVSPAGRCAKCARVGAACQI